MELMVSERIRNLILGDQLTRDEREILEEWLADCDEDEYEEYLRLKSGGVVVRVDDESELEPDDEM